MQSTRAAIYVRESDPRAFVHGYAPEIQERECREMAEGLGYTVDHALFEGWSGVELFERPILTDLRRMIAAREVDAVFFAALDRIARDPVYQQIVISECLHFGVEVFCVHDDLDHTDAGRLIQYVKGYAAKREWEAIRRRTQNGRKARVASGKPIPGPRPMYGYQWADPEPKRKTRLIPDPNTAPVVQRIFREAATGVTRFAIATRLSEDGIPTPTGRNRRWRPETIADILRRPHYVGRPMGWVRRDFYRARAYTAATEAVPLPSGTYPALVAEDEWDKANEWMTIRHNSQPRKTARPQTALLVGGYIRCGYCGRLMSTRWWQGRYQQYRCTGDRSTTHSCEMPSISVTKLDRALWSRLEAFMSRPETILAELEQHRDTDPTTDDMEAVARRMRDIERQQGNLTRRLAMVDDDGIAALVMNELRALTEQLDRLRAERERIEARRRQWETAQEHIDSVAEWCQTVSHNLDSLTYEERRTLLTALDVRVTVWKSDHDPRYTIDAAVSLDSNPMIPDTCRRRCTC